MEFDTSYPPYVVSRRPGGGAWSIVVPWREGTQVRAIRRSELQRLLLRSIEVPSVRPLRVSFVVGSEDKVRIDGRLLFTLPPNAPPVFIANEDVDVSISTPTTRNSINVEWGEKETSGSYPHGSAVAFIGTHRVKEPERAYATTSGLAIEWAGSIPFGGFGDLIAPMGLGPIKRSKRVGFSFEARLPDSDSSVGVSVPLYRAGVNPLEWTLDGQSSLQPRNLDLR